MHLKAEFQGEFPPSRAAGSRLAESHRAKGRSSPALYAAEEIRAHEQDVKPVQVLLNPFVHALAVAEYVLHQMVRPLDFAPDARLSPLDFPIPVNSPVADFALQGRRPFRYPVFNLGKMLILLYLITLLNPKVARVPVKHVVIVPNQIVGLLYVMLVRRRRRNRVHVAGLRVAS